MNKVFFSLCFTLIDSALAQSTQRTVNLINLNTTRYGLAEYQLGEFTSPKVQITGINEYLNRVPAGIGQELKLMIYAGQAMRIAHNAAPNTGQNLFTKSNLDISMPANTWAIANFIYDATLAGGPGMLDYLFTAADELAFARGSERPNTSPNRYDYLGTFTNQKGGTIAYIKSPGSRLPTVVNVSKPTTNTFLAGIAAGNDGQQITLLLYGSSWRLLHAYNSTFCYGCGDVLGYTPKLPTGIKPLSLPNQSSGNYYTSPTWLSTTFVYDAY